MLKDSEKAPKSGCWVWAWFCRCLHVWSGSWSSPGSRGRCFYGCGTAFPLTKASCLLFPGRVGSQQQWERRIPAGVGLQAWVWIQIWQPREKQPVQAINQGIPGSDVLKSCPLLAVYRRHSPNDVFCVFVYM